MRFGMGFGIDVGSVMRRPAFDLNFMGGMPAGLTYTNSSTARAYWDATGTRRSAIANEPIFETLNGVAQGMRWEMEARTNIATNSEGAAATWTVSNVSDAGTPIAGFSASLAFGSNSIARSAYKICAFTLGATYTASSFIVMDDGNAPVVGTTASSGDFALIIDQSVICTTNPTVTRVAGSLYRVSCTGIAATGGASRFGGIVKHTGQSARTFRIIGIQVEAAASPSSYIQTAGSAVTRQPDVLTATSISPWYRQDEGTVVFEGIVNGLVANANGIFVFSDGTVNERFHEYISSSGTLTIGVVDGGVAQASGSTVNAIPANSIFKAAFACKQNDFGACLNGGVVFTDISGTMPTVNQFRLGGITSTGLFPFMGYARRFQYYNSRLTNSEIQGLSRV